MSAIFFAFLSNVFFAIGSIHFSFFSKKISPWWMNTLKVGVCTLGCALVLSFTASWKVPTGPVLIWLMVSGMIGLGLGDLFLLKSFSVLGPGRTLVLFGIHPLMVGLFDFFYFGLVPSLYLGIGVGIMILCLLVFMHERLHSTGKWDLTIFGLALLAVFLDAFGVFLSKLAFKTDLELNSWQANFWRSLFAYGFLLFLGWSKGDRLLRGFKTLNTRMRMIALWASTYGTFLSLSFYFLALSLKGPLTAISAVTITGPIVASALECWQNKQRPSRHLIVALSLFPLGIFFLVLNSNKG